MPRALMDDTHQSPLPQPLPPPLPLSLLPPPPPPPPLGDLHDKFVPFIFPLRSSHFVSYVTASPAPHPSNSGHSFTWTNTSSPPSSGDTKPKPLSSKNFLMVPDEAILKIAGAG